MCREEVLGTTLRASAEGRRTASPWAPWARSTNETGPEGPPSPAGGPGWLLWGAGRPLLSEMTGRSPTFVNCTSQNTHFTPGQLVTDCKRKGGQLGAEGAGQIWPQGQPLGVWAFGWG